MKTRRFFLTLSFVAMALVAIAPSSHGAALAIANSSFELPALGDGGIQNTATLPQQGGYGWNFAQVPPPAFSGIYNPSVGYYTNATGNGTPAGASDAQLSYVFRLNSTAFQTLAGNDAVVGNADDPVLTDLTIYTLTLAVGQRLAGNPSGNYPFGTLEVALLAGSTVIAVDTNVPAPGVGLFADRSISVNSATLNPSLYGQPLSIRIKQLATIDSVADFDNVRLDASHAFLIALVDNGHARITWPTNATGYTLQCTTNLPAPAWTTITNTPTIFGDQFALIVDTSVGSKFYRLRKP